MSPRRSSSARACAGPAARAELTHPAWSRREVAATLLLAVAAALLLGLTSNPGPAQVNDTRAAAYASWALGTQGTTALPEPWPASRNYWGVETAGGRVHVNRFPGVAYWAAPVYTLTDLVADDPPPAHPFLIDLRPAAWSAALTVALAGVVGYALLRRLVPRPAAALAAGLLVIGTGLWPVAADALWPHGPAALLLLAALWSWRSHRGLVLAAAAAGAVLVRPHLVVALVAFLAWSLWREPDRRRTAAAGLAGAAGGLLLLSAYTATTFGRFVPTAGYDAGSHLGGLVDRSPWRTLLDLGLSLGGPPKGLLLFTPVAAVALLAVVAERRRVPAWTVASALAGALYLVVQVRAVGPLGGQDFFGPRTSLETLVLAAPLLTVAAAQVAARSQPFRTALAATAVVSVGLNAYGAVARSVHPRQVARWEAIETTVERDFGHLHLGDVDLRRPTSTSAAERSTDGASTDARPEG